MPEILSPFLRIPLELREQIYGYLLPDRDVTSWNARGSCIRMPYDESRFGSLRCDGGPCDPAILRASRQMNREASAVLYRRIFTIQVRPDGFDFLADSFGTLENIRCFDFGAAKRLRIVILAPSRDQPAQMFVIRENFIALLNVLKRFSHLQDLEIELAYGDQTGAWWSMESKTPTNSMDVGFPDIYLALQSCRLLRNVGLARIAVQPERACEDKMVREWITKFEDLMQAEKPVLKWEIDVVSELTEHMRGELPRLEDDLEDRLDGMYPSEIENYMDLCDLRKLTRRRW